jgi:pimeloyl-ACP methyl ester carboxylesterase
VLRGTAVFLGIAAVVLTAASLAYNEATNGRDRSPAALYAGPFTRVDGTLLAYRRWGRSGSPIVLLGGFAEPSSVWAGVGPLLGRRHRVYALDLPPFGFSERRGPYTLAHWVELTLGFERRLGIVRPVLVGHSLGAAVAVQAALADPAGSSGIVLLDGDALSGGGGAGLLAYLLLPPWYTSAYRLVTGSDWVFRLLLDNAWGPHPPSFDRAFLDEWQRPFRVSGTAEAFRSLLGYGIQGVTLDDLRRVSVRRLVVWGARDSVDSVSAGRRSATALHASFVVIPAAGHLSMLAAPAAVARAIERWTAAGG